jgi:hypothetical protein
MENGDAGQPRRLLFPQRLLLDVASADVSVPILGTYAVLEIGSVLR